MAEGINQSSYTGPVPMVTHVHGAHTHEESDGYTEAWWLPAATNIPSGYFTEGTFYDEFKTKFEARWGEVWQPGTSIFQYPNDQRATTLWYHDHTLGMTRLNVYAGPAGFWNIRGGPDDLPVGVLPGPAPALGDPPGLNYYEIPIVIQDRTFDTNGQLWYPSSRAFFEGWSRTNCASPSSRTSPVTVREATSRPSGTPSSLARLWSSTAVPGRTKRWRNAATASDSSTAPIPAF